MSPNDICLIEDLEDLLEAQIDAFKIDGVLQTEEYINIATEQYRQAIDLYNENPELYEDEKFMLVEPIEEVQKIIVQWIKDLCSNKQFIKLY